MILDCRTCGLFFNCDKSAPCILNVKKTGTSAVGALAPTSAPRQFLKEFADNYRASVTGRLPGFVKGVSNEPS